MHKVVVYHSIAAPPRPLPSNIDISPVRFESHLSWLSRRRQQVVPLQQLVSEPADRELIAITFDDGFRDNLTVALPLLEKYGLPMTLFMVAGFVGKPGYLTASDLRELAAHPLVTIGSHGYSHLHLTRLEPEEARLELAESKKCLEALTGGPIDLLAYPYGDCNAAVGQISAECGYSAAWSVWNGNNTQYSRWRVPLGRQDNLARFVAKISSVYFPLKKLVKPPVVERPAREARQVPTVTE
jgi:peptidoglycan/xylan/chitin deacetylase (PgdA/CDA1 family)